MDEATQLQTDRLDECASRTAGPRPKTPRMARISRNVSATAVAADHPLAGWIGEMIMLITLTKSAPLAPCSRMDQDELARRATVSVVTVRRLEAPRLVEMLRWYSAQRRQEAAGAEFVERGDTSQRAWTPQEIEARYQRIKAITRTQCGAVQGRAAVQRGRSVGRQPPLDRRSIRRDPLTVICGELDAGSARRDTAHGAGSPSR